MNYLRFLSLLLVSLVLTGCSSFGPIQSPPPFSKLVLPKPFHGVGLAFQVTMPAGDYLPVYEDGTDFYYEAPSTISRHTIGTEYFRGGFYVDAVTKTTHGWWYFDEDGTRTRGALDNPLPDYKAIPQQPTVRA